VREVFAAFARSPQWHNGLFVLTYDEWGGFYDHRRPPQLPDDMASAVDDDNFGQAGFRVPTLLASPRALPGAVDHQRYDHTAVLRFLEWRFLGAPARGSRARGSTPWYLHQRDRHANNPGELLSSRYFDPELTFDLDLDIPAPTPGCSPDATATSAARAATVIATEPSPWEEGLATGYWHRAGVRHPVVA
jgi:hypothetical protein